MGTAADTQPAAPRAADPTLVLREFANQWRRAVSLEYRSQIRINHAGEFRLDLRTHIYLRRPGRARLIFRASTFPEADRLRVSDGRMIFDRMFGRPGRRPGRSRHPSRAQTGSRKTFPIHSMKPGTRSPSSSPRHRSPPLRPLGA
jgi:hypothetical protein